jgi:peptidoglycan hydrolase FlgJ
MDQSPAINASLPQEVPSLLQHMPARHADPAVAGKAFEGMLVSMLIKQMRQSLDGTMFGKDSGDVIGGLFDHYMGEHISQSGGFGIGNMIRMQLERRAERTGSA